MGTGSRPSGRSTPFSSGSPRRAIPPPTRRRSCTPSGIAMGAGRYCPSPTLRMRAGCGSLTGSPVPASAGALSLLAPRIDGPTLRVPRPTPAPVPTRQSGRLDPINAALQAIACASPAHEVTAVEAARELDRLGLLRDSPARPGLPLRKKLRAGYIQHAYQVGGRFWFIRCAGDRGLGGRRRTTSVSTPPVATSCRPSSRRPTISAYRRPVRPLETRSAESPSEPVRVMSTGSH